MKSHCEHTDRGYTLVEIIIAIALGLVVMGSIYTIFNSLNKQYRTQEISAEMRQYARAAMDLMVREIRMAGYDPLGIANAGIVEATQDSIRFTLDIRSTYHGDAPDGDTLDSNEDVRYALYTVDGIQKLGRETQGGSPQPVADNISFLRFDYMDTNGNATAVIADIRRVKITLTARSSKPDPAYTDPNYNDHYRRYTLETFVVPRNISSPMIASTTTMPAGVTTTTPATTTTPVTTTTVTVTTTTTPATTTTTTTVPPTTTTTTTTTTVPATTTTTTTVPVTTTTTTTVPATSTTTTVPRDTTGPSITNITRSPSSSPVPRDSSVQVCATVTDLSGLSSVILNSDRDGNIAMTLSSGKYCGTIPRHNGKTTRYYIYAVDTRGNTSVSSTYQYSQNN